MFRFRLVVLIFFSVASASALNAQGNNLAGLPELIGRLPSMSPTERMNLGPYTDAFEASYRRDPSSLDATVSVFKANLSSQDRWVQRTTALLIYSLAALSNKPKFVLNFTDQLARLIPSDDEYTSGAAIYALSILREATPDNVVQSLLATLKNTNSPDRVYAAAVPALLLARPNDTRVEGIVLAAISDPTRTEEQRCNLLSATGGAGGLAGQAIVDYVVSVVKTSSDLDFRDAAVGAAERMGLRALTPIVAKLHAIESDPKESTGSRAGATRALYMQAHTVR